MNPILIVKSIPCWSEFSSGGRAVLLVVGLSLLALSAISCSTTRGFGQDVEKVGDKIQEAAQ